MENLTTMEIAQNPDINLADIPVSAISSKTREKLSCMLNRRKYILSPEPRLYRDYRGLADLMGIGINCWFPSNDYIAEILGSWSHAPDATLDKLQSFFRQIDRYDVLDDTNHMFYTDAAKYIKEQKNNRWISNKPSLPIILNGDLHPDHKYDAFILYADEDEDFAISIITKLESEYKFKLFVKNRDLMPGVTFENKTMMTLFSQRCDRLIVILSNEYFRSDRDKFFHDYVQFLSFEQKGRTRIIPITYKDCELPVDYSIYHLLDKRRDNSLVNFWDKLVKAVRHVNASLTSERIANQTSSSKSAHSDDVTVNKGSDSGRSSLTDASTSSDISLPDVPQDEPRKKKKGVKKVLERLKQATSATFSRQSKSDVKMCKTIAPAF